ncbi:unnamed protein product [Thelazia callipaeda]|uniref:Adenylate kinase isoenzyme 6 homolog n=1 Tax=Thelazia callipaeda TaxID=103827 RepID=A0A0N5D8Y7_THECL|nr:unnamed protein product [Thelazia callipaeda]
MMATPETRKRPNILVTGTPGTGKSTLSVELSKKLGFHYINCGQEAKDNQLFSEYDEDLDTYVLDEDMLLDHLENKMDSEDGGYIVDYHGCDFFPERWFDYVFVLRCNNTLLFDRLTARNYSSAKIKKNIECEIFGILSEEARESYNVRVFQFF